MTTVGEMREAADGRLELAEANLREARQRFEAGLRDLEDARRDVAYWGSVRELDEVLRLCLQSWPDGSVVRTPTQRIERDGRAVYVCLADQPCPVHGRPLGDSDWQLHPVNHGPQEIWGPPVTQSGDSRDSIPNPHRPVPSEPCPRHPEVLVHEGEECGHCLNFNTRLENEVVRCARSRDFAPDDRMFIDLRPGVRREITPLVHQYWRAHNDKRWMPVFDEGTLNDRCMLLRTALAEIGFAVQEPVL